MVPRARAGMEDQASATGSPGTPQPLDHPWENFWSFSCKMTLCPDVFFVLLPNLHFMKNIPSLLIAASGFACLLPAFATAQQNPWVNFSADAVTVEVDSPGSPSSREPPRPFTKSTGSASASARKASSCSGRWFAQPGRPHLGMPKSAPQPMERKAHRSSTVSS